MSRPRVGVNLSKNLGAALALRRKELGLNQGDVAMTAGVGPMFVSRLENGEGDGAELSRVMAVASALGLEITVEKGPIQTVNV